MKLGFNNEKYISLQSEKILKRVKQYDNKLYLEFGGKLFDDYHASRVLPGFHIDSKIRMLQKIKDKVEILICINANDIQNHTIRKDLNITYEMEVFRMIEYFLKAGLIVENVVVTFYTEGTVTVDNFITKLKNRKINVYKHYLIDGYPFNVNAIVSDTGFGRNEYVKTKRPLVVVTGPGPASGKLATCLSQLYNENKHGIRAGYAKFETFPVWNLPLRQPLNLAYEAATANLNDVNVIDPFHLEAYGENTVNYNRDVQAFPVVKRTLEAIHGRCPYKSPTDMGVNMVGFSIDDFEVVNKASKQEIIRRYLITKLDILNGLAKQEALDKIQGIMDELNISTEDRKTIKIAKEFSLLKKTDAGAIELPDGTFVTGKSSSLFTAPSALLLNSLKHICHINKEIDILSLGTLESIQKLKSKAIGNNDVCLYSGETLIALAISAEVNPLAKLALDNLHKLKNSEAHFTLPLSSSDLSIYKKLGINVTCEAEYSKDKLFIS